MQKLTDRINTILLRNKSIQTCLDLRRKFNQEQAQQNIFQLLSDGYKVSMKAQCIVRK